MAKTTQDQINEGLAKANNAEKRKLKFALLDPEELTKSGNETLALEKSIINSAYDIKKGGHITRLSFEQDPQKTLYFQSLWKPKRNQIPDEILKKLSIQNSLVATITLARGNHICTFGNELLDRFSTGFRIEPNKGVMERASSEEREELNKRIKSTSKTLLTCGSLEGVEPEDRENFSTYLYLQARNAVVFGRFATEFINIENLNGTKEFHSFRAVDAGTIYQANPHSESAKSIRNQALRMLSRLKNEDLDPQKFRNDEYKWIQVSQGRPIQAFAGDELAVCNVYPITDIELGGYPITPMDIAINSIITHINISNHNKLYFQNGRAARGMVVIKSLDVDQAMITQIKQEFNASINGASKSWRVPVFGIDPEEEVSWQPMELQGGRDAEFQYLSDQNAREILSAFHMSPEELPGYQHLSRGTNNQALSESSNEFRLTSARDVGLRPLLAKIQDFVNDFLIPIIDPKVAELCTFKFYGLDADTQEKEDTRLQQETSIYLTYDDIMQRTDRHEIGKKWGGKLPLNPAIQSVFDKYLTVGEILEHFFGREGAAKDPSLQYRRDPFWVQFQQFNLQVQQRKAEMQQSQQQNQRPPPGQEQQPEQEGQQQAQSSGELEAGVDQLSSLLGLRKAEDNPNVKRLLAQHEATVDHIMDNWEKESQEALAEITNLTSKNSKKQ